MTEPSAADLWTTEAHLAYQAAVDLVSRALDEHAGAIAAKKADDLVVTAAALEAALADLSEVEVALTGSAAFWLDTEDTEGTDTDDTGDTGDTGDSGDIALDEPAEGTPAVVNLQLSLDVLDVDGLITAARELDGDAQVDTVEDALFVIGARAGWDAVIIDQVDAIRMRSLATEVHVRA